MARLYPPITEEKLPAFCLTYNDKGEKIGATIKINFNLNRAVANSEISGIALRLRTISTNSIVINEDLAINPNIGSKGQSEGRALSYDLTEGTCIFSITNEYNPEVIDKLKVGQYYKAQLAFINSKNLVGYWSTVATIKCVARPTVRIANFHSDDINAFANEIVGEYIQNLTAGDYTEKVYSYSFQLFDKDGETIKEETSSKLHNSSYDVTSSSSTDIYYCYQDLDENEIYYIQYNVVTVNGLELSSPKYQLMNIGSIHPEEEIALHVFNGTEKTYKFTNKKCIPYEEGVIEIYLDFVDEKNKSKRLTGNFVLLRSSSVDNFTTWQEVRRFRLSNDKPSQKIIYDYTVEQGVSYKYAIQQYNRQGFYSDKVYAQDFGKIDFRYRKDMAKTVKADFEDMFLYDGKKQLKIRFNPKVNSFKNNLQEQKIDTIGSKYPFIFRNGNVCYKEFPISGLISFQEDNANFFIDENDYQQMELERFEDDELRSSPKYNVSYKKLTRVPKADDFPLYIIIEEEANQYSNDKQHEMRQQPIGTKNISYYRKFEKLLDLKIYAERQGKRVENIEVYKRTVQITNTLNNVNKSLNYSKTDLTSDNIKTERYFKLSILDWLTDGKPKLFRSPTEGNYIVRLLNVSLTPKNELGRMLHEFSCTAYEIAEFNYNSLVELGLLTVQEPFNLDFQWQSKNIKNFISASNSNLDENGDRYYPINLDNKQAYGFSLTGFAPGDKIKIVTTEDSTPVVIVIGQTGSYIYEDALPIVSLSVSIQNNTDDFPRDLLLKLQGYNYQKFDLISSINLFTQKGEQIVGKSQNIFEKNVVNSKYNNLKTLGYGLNYYLSKNIYLSESFIPVSIDKETYDKNIYYIANKNGYKIPINENGIKSEYNESSQYYKRNFSGEKVIITDLLYLHAKRREVIPIFVFNKKSPRDYLIVESLPQLQFSLTPFGNGYVHYKNISPDFNSSRYEVLTEAERTRAMEIHDLVDFTIDKCGVDQFCLFEVYVPKTRSNSNIIDWVPYITADKGTGPYGGSTLCGIFDPYLYSQNPSESFAGWWGKETYNPTFTIGYDEDENYHQEEISLENDIEIKLKNIKIPTLLTTGNGITMELFYRVKYIDYTIEEEQTPIKQKKNNFLNIQQNAQANKSLYRLQSYFKPIRESLTQTNLDDLEAIVNSNEDYIETVKKLTELSRTAQIKLIKKYLQKEKSLVDTTLNQLQEIDDNLKYDFGLSDNIFYSNLIQAKTNYTNYIQNQLKLSNDNILPPLENYEKKEVTFNDTKEMLEGYYDNIVKSSTWNFIEKINTILSTLKTEADERERDILDLDTKQYVSQYIELLQERGQDIFFQTYIVDDYNYSYPIGKWINKKSISSFAPYVDLDSEVWDNYFHVSSNNKLVTLGNISYSTKEKKYVITNLDFYLPDNEENPINISTSQIYQKKFENDKNLITLIKEKLAELNEISLSVVTTSDYKKRWGIDWTSTKPVAFSLYGTTLLDKQEKMGLGILKLTNGKYTIKKSILETSIDEAFENNILTSNSSLSQIESFLKSNKYGDFPKTLITKLAEIIYTYIKPNGLRSRFQDIYSFYEYITIPENETRLTEEQKVFINSQFKNYYEDLQDESDWIDVLDLSNNNSSFSKFYKNGREDSFQLWYDDYAGANGEDSTEILDKKEEIDKYKKIFNDIILAKKTSINNFTKIRDKIIALKNKPGVKSSDNIRLLLHEEKEQLEKAHNSIEQLLSYFKLQQNGLQEKYEYNGYLNFLTSFLNLSDNQKIYSTSKEYKQFIAQAINIKSIDNNCQPQIQDANVAAAWKAFLDILSQTYKKIEEKGSLS